MASFSIKNYGSDYINITVNPSPGYTAYRVFVRLTSDAGNVTFDRWYTGITASFDAYVSGLSPNTSYTVNVAYNTSATATGSTWLNAQEVITNGGGSGTYYAYIAFDANGGTGAPGNVYGTSEYGTSYVVISIPYEQPTRNGYTFVGWHRSASATSPEYYSGSNITLTNVSTTYPGPQFLLYAVWEKSSSSGNIYISNGVTYNPYEVYIYNGGWRKYIPYVFNGSWRQCGS